MWKAWSFVIGLVLMGWLLFTGNQSHDLFGVALVLLAIPLFWAAGELVMAVLRSTNIL